MGHAKSCKRGKRMKDEKIERLLIRPVEAFEIIGVSRSTGYALISAGELPVVRIGP
jgi:predicted DNA-binding transcriptional regulator AlpA